MNNVPCRYFKSTNGCRWGESCRFDHSNTGSAQSQNSTACRFYGSSRGCRFGSNCFYKHNASANQNQSQLDEEANESDEAEPMPDGQDELIVFGYIRSLSAKRKLEQNENEEDKEEIPTELKELCQSFYSVIIKWEISKKWISQNMSVVDNGNCVKMSNGNNWGSAFLTEEYFEGVHHWKFKIESLDSRRQYYVCSVLCCINICQTHIFVRFCSEFGRQRAQMIRYWIAFLLTERTMVML